MKLDSNNMYTMSCIGAWVLKQYYRHRDHSCIHFFIKYRAAGEGLVDLFDSNSVQVFYDTERTTPRQSNIPTRHSTEGNDVIMHFMQNNIYTTTFTCISYSIIILYCIIIIISLFPKLRKGKCKL